MDDLTLQRHKAKPDYALTIHATGVKLPDGKVSWRLLIPEKTPRQWLAVVLRQWAKQLTGTVLAK